MSIVKLFVALSISAFLFAQLVQMALAQNGQPGHRDEAIFQRIISGQISAFRNSDAEGAFVFASPGIKKQMGDARTFMKMVEARYLPVFNPLAYKFTQSRMIGKRPVQALDINGPQGGQWTAFYFFEQQKDKTWRISGVVLKRRRGVGV